MDTLPVIVWSRTVALSLRGHDDPLRSSSRRHHESKGQHSAGSSEPAERDPFQNPDYHRRIRSRRSLASSSRLVLTFCDALHGCRRLQFRTMWWCGVAPRGVTIRGLSGCNGMDASAGGRLTGPDPTPMLAPARRRETPYPTTPSGAIRKATPLCTIARQSTARRFRRDRRIEKLT